MLERLQQLTDRLHLDPSRASLGAWIAAINVAIVVLVVGGISLSAIGSLRHLADEQGRSRVQLAGALAREELRRFGEDALIHARSVADRQTLQRLLADGRAAAIGPYLRRSCNTDSITACAVFERGALVALAGVQLPWKEMAETAAEQGERFLAAPSEASSPVIGASAQIGGARERRAYVARLFDEKLAATLSERAGVVVRLVDSRRFVGGGGGGALGRWHSAGLSDGTSAVARIGSENLYAASFRVSASTGEAVALLEARLPAAQLD